MLALDLGVFHRHSHEPSLKESAMWTVIWAALALAFNALVWHWGGAKAGVQLIAAIVRG